MYTDPTVRFVNGIFLNSGVHLCNMLVYLSPGYSPDSRGGCSKDVEMLLTYSWF